LRFAIDTGGTFTDLLVEEEDGTLRMFKASTTPHDPIEGMLDALRFAADDLKLTLPEMLGAGSTLIYGTTHPINAAKPAPALASAPWLSGAAPHPPGARRGPFDR
jgi:N-methylhydantoinase A